MAGQICAGQNIDDIKNAKLRNSKAFCEGYLARSLEVSPTNPHPVGSEAAAAFTLGVADKLGGSDPLCCAPCGPAAVVAVNDDG